MPEDLNQLEEELSVKCQLIEKQIIEGLPQVPYVIDRVDNAIQWIKSLQKYSTYFSTLTTAVKVMKYVTEISEPNYFKVHLLVTALLMDVPEPEKNERFNIYKTASGVVEKALSEITVKDTEVEEKGCFKAMSVHVIDLLRNNEELAAIYLIALLTDLEETVAGMKKANVKAPITGQDYIKILGYDMVLTNIRMSNLNLLNTTRDIINQINIILNNDVNY